QADGRARDGAPVPAAPGRRARATPTEPGGDRDRGRRADQPEPRRDPSASSPALARPCSPVHWRSPIALPTSLPPRSTRKTVGVYAISYCFDTSPFASSNTVDVTALLFTHPATRSRFSPRLIASTTSPWSLSSRFTCSIVEGSSRAQ